MKKIAVFDLDGTLAHTAPTLAAGMNIFLRESGREEIPYELMEAFLGNGARVLLNNVYEYLGLPREKKDIDEALEGFFVYRMAWYERIISAVGGLLLIYPGIVTDIIGISLVGFVLLLQTISKRRAAKTI